MHTNRLASEKSPYLLQHAHNPVDWHAWNDEAFAKAREEDKPIFLSIGYSTCHWCHVMERESFESEEIAEILNRYFIPVKVDREERPDVDRIYMTFVQATTGGGGWPMSVWLTPDLKPFYGGTYYPPTDRWGRPGFRTILDHIAGVWKGDRKRVVDSSDDIVKQLSGMVSAKAPGALLDDKCMESCFNTFRRSFDSRFGGFGNAPKFPRPVQFHFLHRYFVRTGNEEAAEMSLHTLQEMRKGGMYDQLGGGFHRYSVDGQWFVPHFEKMLYDQGQLVNSYLEAYQLTGEDFFAEVARETLDYVLRDMTDPGGGFYSAEDADSVIDPLDPKEKGEGAFYIWTASEVEEVLRKPESDWFQYRFGMKPTGNVDEDPHNEFTGRNILFEAHSIEETAAQFGVSESDVKLAFLSSQRKLMERRATRVRPHLDDKILTAWNGLMISAFAKAAQALGDADYLNAAKRAADFVLTKMRSGDKLLRRFRAGDAAIDAFLDDYAFFIQALLDLYEASFDTLYLQHAARLGETMMLQFEDPKEGGFFSTTGKDERLVLRIKDDYDGAEPSGNSSAVLSLLRLSHFTNKDVFRAAATRTLEAFAGRLNSNPMTLPQMVSAYMFFKASAKQIILVGEDTSKLLAEVRRRFMPHSIVIRIANNADRQFFAEWIPAVDGMHSIDGKAAAYLCENYTCQLPVTDPEAFVKLMEG